jgi:hypothetical protein
VTTPSPPPGYASDPQLEMLWNTPPSFTGVTASGSSTTTPPLSLAFRVALASVQSAESTMLGASSAIVPVYNTMDAQVQSAISNPSLYGQEATVTEHVLAPGSRPIATPPVIVNDVPLQQAGQQFAAQINPAMTRALRSVADTMLTVGIFIAMLNDAGQVYTTADKNSAVPPPTSS